MDYVQEKVDFSIQRLVEDFSRIPNKYLTEDDVRMHLCMLLMDDFGSEEMTQDSDLSIALHSEIRWWGPNHRKDRTDIVIFDVSGLSVTKGVIDGLYKFDSIPKKGYGSNTPLVAIELKLRRNDGVGNKAFRNQIKKDIDKLNELREIFRDHYSQRLVCRVVALDKKELISNLSFDVPGVYLSYKFSNRQPNV